jgi:Rrf2 family nitric oxide-sensitive transcriptional repressor
MYRLYSGCQYPVFQPGGENAVISQTVEYALRAVAHLAQQSPRASTTEEIAAVTRVPRAYLSKVLQALARKGVVSSQRGIGGGMTLVKSPAELTILEVVNAVEPIQRIRTCPLGLASHGIHLCPLHRRLDDALAMMEEAFRRSTLAEILAEPSRSTPLCEIVAPVESAGGCRLPS